MKTKTPCRFLSVIVGLFLFSRHYNHGMKLPESYIPKEYLALKINYCKKQLAMLPEIFTTRRKIKGIERDLFLVNSHIYYQDGFIGKKLQQQLLLREKYICELSKLEGLWSASFRGVPSTDLEPRNINRLLYTGNNESVVINKEFFNSLKNDANPYYPEHKTHYYNGTFYRSPAEASIARFYTEQGIPFKYEPEIWLRGLNHPVYTDFVLLIKELNLCKFQEHFGLKNSSDYTRKTATTYTNYSGAGLLPELDVFYTYDLDGVPFDIRSLHTKLNSVIYNSLFVL